METNRQLQVLAAVFALGGSTFAPTLPGTADEAHVIRWTDIVRQVDRHPRLKESAALQSAAKGRVAAAAQVPNPAVEANLGWGASTEAAAAGFEWGVALSIPLEWLALRGYEIDAAKAELDAAGQDGLVVRLDVLLQLRTLYLELAHARALLASLSETEAQTAQLAGLVRRRVELGEARPAEAPKAEIELQKVVIDLERAKARERIARSQLGLWLGVSGQSDFAIEADLDALPPPPEIEKVVAKVRSEHPAVRAAASRAAARSAEVLVERRKRLPALSIRAFREREVDRIAYGGSIGVEIPVWNWNSGRIAQAEAQKAAEENKADAALAELLLTVVDAHQRCSQGRETAGRFKKEIIPKAEQAAASVERLYGIGETALLDVLDSRRTLSDARREQLSAQLEANLDCSRLNLLVGEEVPE